MSDTEPNATAGRRLSLLALAALAVLSLAACGGEDNYPPPVPADAGAEDAGQDAGAPPSDAGLCPLSAGGGGPRWLPGRAGRCVSTEDSRGFASRAECEAACLPRE